MLVTGVQAAGSKGMTAIQGTVVDLKSTTRPDGPGDRDAGAGSHGPAKSGDPQPVVFPRKGLPMDQRPVSMRHEHAARRYRSDGGGEHPGQDDAA
jgi:hypothetical protein